ncbi:hypothetical protein [Rickettsiella endosymbiont of Aleochara curtula]|uniref:hypothetical protein n=1 Tax=Rickettsiella endosymbiont of Aleochara curtula TaxID=3077936 RepID=UPI00313B067E
MELFLQNFCYIYNKKNLIMNSLLELKDLMLNYISLTYALLLYLLKLMLIRIFIFSNKIIPIKIKFKLKKIIFNNANFWMLLVYIKKWIITPPSANKIRRINNIVFHFISLFFIPLFFIILKKENWEILMIEKLKKNFRMKEKFNKFTTKTEISEKENICIKINIDNLTKNEIDIFKKFNNAFFLKKNNRL